MFSRICIENGGKHLTVVLMKRIHVRITSWDLGEFRALFPKEK